MYVNVSQLRARDPSAVRSHLASCDSGELHICDCFFEFVQDIELRQLYIHECKKVANDDSALLGALLSGIRHGGSFLLEVGLHCKDSQARW